MATERDNLDTIASNTTTMAGGISSTAMGAVTDAPDVRVEDGTASNFIKLIKGIKNHVYSSALSLASIAKRYSQNTNLKIDFASVSEQTIIAAPSAGYRIVIQSIFMTCLVNNIVVMKSGSTEVGKAYVYGFSKDYISGLILGTAEAFKLTATTADPIYGQVCYYVEAV
jgi:hypothetical protein